MTQRTGNTAASETIPVQPRGARPALDNRGRALFVCIISFFLLLEGTGLIEHQQAGAPAHRRTPTLLPSASIFYEARHESAARCECEMNERWGGWMLAPLAVEAVITGFLEAAGREEGGWRRDEARDRRAGRRFSFHLTCRRSVAGRGIKKGEEKKSEERTRRRMSG